MSFSQKALYYLPLNDHLKYLQWTPQSKRIHLLIIPILISMNNQVDMVS
jgi:hypothetical protein